MKLSYALIWVQTFQHNQAGFYSADLELELKAYVFVRVQMIVKLYNYEHYFN